MTDHQATKDDLGDEANLLSLEICFLMSEAKLLLAEDDMEDHLGTHDAQSILSALDYRLMLPAAIMLMIAKLQCVRYVNDRESIPRSSGTLDLLLNYYHDHNPKMFRKKLRVYPETFDALVNILREAPVFATLDTRKAISIETHLAVLLYRLGHYGNGASMEEVASWAGIGIGTVDRITRRTLLAIFQIDLESCAIKWPSPAEREQYKQWVDFRLTVRAIPDVDF